MNKAEIAASLEHLSTFTAGWYDGVGLPPDPLVLQRVVDFLTTEQLRTLELEPDIIPTVSGSIQLEWHTSRGDLIVTPEISGDVSFYYCDSESGIEIEESLSAGAGVIIRTLVEKLCEEQ